MTREFQQMLKLAAIGATGHAVDMSGEDIDWQKVLDERGYAKDGTANFAVWSNKEYNELQQILYECISVVTDFNRKTAEIAANITADLAPTHIRQPAESVGALVYRFYSIDKLVSRLYEMEWIKAVADHEKPAICVVKN